jgi:hypothetical protein
MCKEQPLDGGRSRRSLLLDFGRIWYSVIFGCGCIAHFRGAGGYTAFVAPVRNLDELYGFIVLLIAVLYRVLLSVLSSLFNPWKYPQSCLFWLDS